MNRLFLFALLLTGMPALAQQPAAPSQEEREKIEKVVREYLLRNPSLVREALVVLQAEEETQRTQRAKQALAGQREALLQDASSPVGGNPKGDVTVVEFFDYSCPHCKRAAPALLEVMQRDPGVRIVYKEYPILGPQSFYASRAALAAARQGKYSAFHAALMASRTLDEPAIRGIAKKLSLDVKRLLADMEDPAIVANLQKTQQLAAAIDVNGTPAFIVGDTLIPGATNATALLELVNAERARLKDQ